VNTAIKLVREVTSRGGRIQIRDGKLQVDAPKGVITPNIKLRLKKHKSDLLKLEQWEFQKLELRTVSGVTQEWMFGRRLDQPGKTKLWPVEEK
jgi:hypothetical protein